MHVRERVAHAVVDRVRTIAAFEGRVWAYGSVGWDRRSHPMAIVSGLKSKVTVEEGSDGRLQRRDVEVLVEIYDQETSGGDYVVRLGELGVAVEAVVQDLPDFLPIESVECRGDTGVTDVDEDERGVRAGTGITFSVSFYTETGNAGAFVAPNY